MQEDGERVELKKIMPKVSFFAKQLKKSKKRLNPCWAIHLVTIQTGDEGQEIKTIYVTDGVDIDQEFYLGILLDRAKSKNVIMVSTEGGVEIEKVAEETPEKIIKEWVEPGMDLQHNQARRLAFALGFEGDAFKKAVKFIMASVSML
jgi:succinyl-CoA synthetase beta subunit